MLRSAMSTSSTTPRLIMLPGLGADARLLTPQAAAFPGLVTPAWIEPKRNESLPDYAARFAATFALSQDTIIGGVSFGGMVALEIARQCRVRAAAVIAT